MDIPPSGEDADNDIGVALRKRDHKRAFHLLVVHHGVRIHSLCFRMLKDRARAEDMMQESLIKAFETIEKLRDPTRLRAWVMRIAVRQCLDHLRTSRRRGADTVDVEELGLDGDLLAMLASSEEKRALEDCVARLPPSKRAAVLGRFFLDLAYADLSAASDEPADTVRIRVDRALVDLRNCLAAKGVHS